MADKQFARSGPAEFDVLADDDPLAELARIVGYDARPAVQQLQELQRHQEAVRQDPAFDLEEELLREFDTYDAPRAVDVQPDSGPAEQAVAPAEEVATQLEPVPEFAPVEFAVAESAPVEDLPAIEPAYEPIAQAWPEAAADEVDRHHAEVAAVSEIASFEADFGPAADVAAQDFASHEVEPSFDLERELELSLGDVDLSPTAEISLAEPQSVAHEEWHAPAADIAFDVPEFAGEGAAQQAALPVEPVFHAAPVAEASNAYASHDAYAYESAVIEAASPVAMEPATDNGVDQLLADIERYPVPAATGLVAAAVHAHPAVHARVEPVAAPVAPVRKSPYPFTPTFSRATPVASASGVGQQRAFAGPIVSSLPAAAAPAVAVAAPAVVPVAEPARAAIEPENEPSFDIENFEMELSDVAMELELPDFDASEDMAAAVQQPVLPVAEPAPVPVQREEPYHAPQVAAAPIEFDEPPVESALPFDPSMIAEADTGVAPIADMDVPQLPVIETEKPAAYPADYDLDIDAEMAQLFGTPAPITRETQARPGEAREAARAAAPAAKPAMSHGAAPMDDFDEFEKAMEEDFRRSMVERQNAPREAERVQPMSGQADANGYNEYGSGRRSQRGMLLAASVAGVIILGGAGVYAWMGGSDAASSAEGPKIILADKSPVKVVPEEKGGKTVPNQDKAVYDRVAGAQGTGPRQEALVSSTEEPMDVVQRTLTPENLPNDSSDEIELGAASPAADEDAARLLPDDGATAPAEEDKAPAVAPRKVRTMIVKPDGTLVAREEPVAAPATEVAGNAQSVPATAAGQAASSGIEGQATATGAGSDLRAAGEATAGADQVALAAASNATVNSAGQQAPLPQTRPAAEQPTTVAAAATARPAEAQAAASAAADTQQVSTASVPVGSYFIQVASLPSEAEAQKSYNSLSNKFGSVIGGRGVDIRKAEIAGKGTYYRVRIPAGSREEANALCTRYKGAGGSCLVTK